MKSLIYIIKNKINDKVYIGQITLSLKERLKKHIQDSRFIYKNNRPLYNAFLKYGYENFYIELIEECDNKDADEKEIYWIKYYKSNNSKNGYNATIGGSKYEPYDYDYVADLIKNGLTTIEIVRKIGCCKQLVYRVANKYNLKITGGKNNKKIAQYSLDDKLLNVFDSINEAAIFIKKILIQIQKKKQ